MIRCFLPLVSVVVVSSAAVAQLPGAYYQPRPVCTGPQCGGLPAAVQTVRSAVADGFYRVGGVVGGHQQYGLSQPVYGYWSPPIPQPWYVPPPQPVPMWMPSQTCPPGGCQPCQPGTVIRYYR